MSWTMWHVNGPGFDVSGVANEKWESFLEDHRTALEKVYSADFLDGLGKIVKATRDSRDGWSVTGMFQEATENGTASTVAAAVMWQETGIRFSSPGLTDEGEDCVLFLNASPWEYNERERNLTQDGLFGLMRMYADELGVNFDPDLDLIYAG